MSGAREIRRGAPLLCAGLLLLLLPTIRDAAGQDPPDFLHVLTGEPLDLAPRPGEALTPAVEEFHRSGRNPHAEDRAAIAEGRRLYLRHCSFCHLIDGSGGNAPPIDGSVPWTYATSGTDAGMFAVIFGGAFGAMRSWAMHGMTQDEMLRIIAYLRRLAQPGPERDEAVAAAAAGAGAPGVH